MKPFKLEEKIQNIKAASEFEHKLIDEIYSIMSLKRKAEHDYKNSLQVINRQIQKYLVADNGFLTDIMKSYQSYITVVYQNQSTLIEGYDNEILSFLVKAKQSKFQGQIMKKVLFVDEKVESCKNKIKQYKKLIRGNEEQLQMISSEVTFKSRVNELSEEERKKMGQKYNDIQNLKKINEESLEQHIDGMMDLTMIHNNTVEELNEYESVYLEQKANDVFDNFMRAFVLEVSFIRSMQFDVSNILTKVNDGKEEKRRISFQALRKKMEKERGLRESLWNTYKKWTTPQIGVDITQNYISSRIRDKWKRVCEYYNSAASVM